MSFPALSASKHTLLMFLREMSPQGTHLYFCAAQEEEDSSGSEDADLVEEEDFQRRYSLRNRSLAQRYSPRADQAGAFTVGSKRSRSIVEEVLSSR